MFNILPTFPNNSTRVSRVYCSPLVEFNLRLHIPLQKNWEWNRAYNFCINSRFLWQKNTVKKTSHNSAQKEETRETESKFFQNQDP